MRESTTLLNFVYGGQPWDNPSFLAKEYGPALAEILSKPVVDSSGRAKRPSDGTVFFICVEYLIVNGYLRLRKPMHSMDLLHLTHT